MDAIEAAAEVEAAMAVEVEDVHVDKSRDP